ncbi:hypothetical protein CLF_103800 [Clonorchis sinensis]|uniref:Uncharacterized protein n=1 Tax=Clonorchis sinensis TaxID=79923 RepID=G7YAE9_CLOSI|nr:hypothetical protein CLF_103800 [Clonorchis sinensis]
MINSVINLLIDKFLGRFWRRITQMVQVITDYAVELCEMDVTEIRLKRYFSLSLDDITRRNTSALLMRYVENTVEEYIVDYLKEKETTSGRLWYFIEYAELHTDLLYSPVALLRVCSTEGNSVYNESCNIEYHVELNVYELRFVVMFVLVVNLPDAVSCKTWAVHPIVKSCFDLFYIVRSPLSLRNSTCSEDNRVVDFPLYQLGRDPRTCCQVRKCCDDRTRTPVLVRQPLKTNLKMSLQKVQASKSRNLSFIRQIRNVVFTNDCNIHRCQQVA